MLRRAVLPLLLAAHVATLVATSVPSWTVEESARFVGVDLHTASAYRAFTVDLDGVTAYDLTSAAGTDAATFTVDTVFDGGITPLADANFSLYRLFRPFTGTLPSDAELLDDLDFTPASADPSGRVLVPLRGTVPADEALDTTYYVVKYEGRSPFDGELAVSAQLRLVGDGDGPDAATISIE
jgi:hypothetical protein